MSRYVVTKTQVFEVRASTPAEAKEMTSGTEPFAEDVQVERIDEEMVESWVG